MQRMRRTSKTRRWIELALLLTGVIAVGIWAWSHVRMTVSQMWGNRALDHQIHGRSAGSTPAPRSVPQPPPLQNGALLGRLEIPRLKMRSVVREGAGQDTLDVALGHIPGTAMPGQPGNTGIAGHRDTLFRGLRKIEKDDVIEFQSPQGTYDYKVENTRIVKPSDVAVLKPTGGTPELTLVTCYPFYYVGSAPDRFIVKARLVTPPAAAEAPKAEAPKPLPVVAMPRPEPRPSPAILPARVSTPRRQRDARPVIRKVSFRMPLHQSRELAPGITLRLTATDPVRRRVNGSLWIPQARRTIWLSNQAVQQPVFFRASANGGQRELLITSVTHDAVYGYLSSMTCPSGCK
jgi:sortase A